MADVVVNCRDDAEKLIDLDQVRSSDATSHAALRRQRWPWAFLAAIAAAVGFVAHQPIQPAMLTAGPMVFADAEAYALVDGQTAVIQSGPILRGVDLGLRSVRWTVALAAPAASLKSADATPQSLVLVGQGVCADRTVTALRGSDGAVVWSRAGAFVDAAPVAGAVLVARGLPGPGCSVPRATASLDVIDVADGTIRLSIADPGDWSLDPAGKSLATLAHRELRIWGLSGPSAGAMVRVAIPPAYRRLVGTLSDRSYLLATSGAVSTLSRIDAGAVAETVWSTPVETRWDEQTMVRRCGSSVCVAPLGLTTMVIDPTSGIVLSEAGGHVRPLGLGYWGTRDSEVRQERGVLINVQSGEPEPTGWRLVPGINAPAHVVVQPGSGAVGMIDSAGRIVRVGGLPILPDRCDRVDRYLVCFDAGRPSPNLRVVVANAS